jgi:Flp pilus assembly protein TadG
VSRRPLRRPRTASSDRGSTALEFAVLSVAFLLLVFLVVQAALYYHARNVIKAEAEGVARAVRAYPATATGALRDQVPPPGQVQSLAQTEANRQWQILDNGGDTTSAPQVQAVVVDFDQVRVTVSAKPIMILPGLFGSDLEITQTAGGPFEVFKRSGDD